MTTPNDNDRDPIADLLARALRDEADQVETDPAALQRIQRRTATAPSGLARRGWTRGAFATLGAGLAAAAVITAVVLVSDDQDDDSGRIATSPSNSTAPTSEAPTDDAPSVTPMHEGVFDPSSASNVTLYYVGVGELTNEAGNLEGTSALYTEPHTVSDTSAEAAVREFLTSRPLDPDYTTGWPERIDVSSIEVTGDQAAIALFGEADVEAAPDLIDGDVVNEQDAERQAAEFAIQGLIRTAGITEGTVSFTYNDEPLDTLLGIDVAAGVEVLPEKAQDFSTITRARAQITSPVEGQTVSNPVVVTGNGGLTFEGQVNWDLLDAQDRELDSGFVTLAMDRWMDFEVDLGSLDPGTYTFRTFEISAANGEQILYDDKTFTVQ